MRLIQRSPRCALACRSTRDGFSLIELMGILLLIGMLAALVMVSWESVLPRAELNSTVRRLAAALSEARSDAIARNAEFRVEYYFEETPEHPRGYRVVTPFRRGTTGGLATTEEERMARAWVPLPKGIHFSSITIEGRRYDSGMVAVHFDPLGAASDHLIVLEQRPYGNFYTIEVLALTGLIRFHDGAFARPFPQESDFQ